ncbi:hypothetical protein V866_008421 [Kwoniella sp. B9012]
MLVLTAVILPVLVSVYHYFSPTFQPLLPLFRKSNHTVIQFPTRELSGGRVTLLLVYHIIRSLLRRIGFGPRLSIIEEHGRHGAVYKIKDDISLSMPFQIISSDIDNYLQCLLSSSSSSPSITKQDILSNGKHLQLLLSALTEPSMLLLLSKVNCPIDPIGSVNVRNKFTLIDLPLCQRSLQNTLDSESKGGPGMIARSKLDQGVKKVKRGWEFTVIVELLLDQTGNGTGSAIYKQEFTMLQFHKHPQLPSIPPPNSTNSINVESIGMFDIGKEEPWNWARLSKDYNPIHTSSTAAKLLGFKGKIAHGNHIVSKAIQQLSHQKIQMDKGMQGWIIVEFKRPIVVPSTLEIKMYPQKTEKKKQIVEIWMNGKVATTITFGS